MIQQGLRIYLNVSNMNKQGRALAGFCGDFIDGEPRSGKFIFSDGGEETR